MSDIFGRSVSNLAGAFTADSAVLTFAGGLISVVQQLSFNYAQTVTRLWEVGGPNMYYVGGRTNGQMGINRVIGPSNSVSTLYSHYGDVCNSQAITLNMVTGCNTNTHAASAGVNITYVLNNCVITQVAIGTQAQDMIISENTTLMYASLELQGTAGAAGVVV